MDQLFLKRQTVLPTLFPNPEKYLFITGLAGAAKDGAVLTKDGTNIFTMAGTMGAAISMGLGVSLSAPKEEVVVVSGDGEILMNLGALATVATTRPPNLSIICMDNGCHSETGGQLGHTSHYTNLAKIAEGAGFSSVLTITNKKQLEMGTEFLENKNGPHFILIKINVSPPQKITRNLNPADCRLRFRNAFLK